MAKPLLLFETYSELISDITGLVVSHKSLVASDVRATIKERLAAAKIQCGNYSDEEIRQAEFAVCASIDEYVLAKNWLGSAEWRNNLLQDEYFNTTDAGILFYTRAERLSDQQLDLLHLYFFCLATGFRGQYFPTTKNEAIVVSMKALLSKIGHSKEEALLATQGLLVGCAKNKSLVIRCRWFERTIVWVLVPLVICAGLYGYFYFTIMNSVRYYLAAVS